MGEVINTTDVPIEDVKWMWPLVEEYIQSALDKGLGQYDIVDVFNGLMDETMRLWVTYEQDNVLGVAVTMVHAYPRKRVAHVLLMSGRGFELWSEQIKCIESWAKQNGAELLTAHTRPGVAKEMQAYGFRNTHQVICKVLALPSHLH